MYEKPEHYPTKSEVPLSSQEMAAASLRLLAEKIESGEVHLSSHGHDAETCKTTGRVMKTLRVTIWDREYAE